MKHSKINICELKFMDKEIQYNILEDIEKILEKTLTK